MGVGTSILIGSGIALGTSFFASGEQASASAAGLEAQARGIDLATASQEELLRLGLEFGAPFRQAGREALPGFAAAALDPRLSQQAQLEREFGEEAILRGASAAGKIESGQTARQGSDLFSRILAGETGRRQGRILDLANIGVGASQQGLREALGTGQGLAQSQLQFGQSIADILGAQGQLRASQIGTIGQFGQAGVNAFALNQALQPQQTIFGAPAGQF